MFTYDLAPLAPIQAPASPSAHQAVEGQLDFLAAETLKVERYQRELKKRADALDAVLKNLEVLDTSPEFALRGGEEGFGIGGGEETESTEEQLVPRLDLSLNRPGSVGDSFSQGAFSRVLLKDIDHKVSLLEELPLGMPVNGHVSSTFGPRRSPYSRRVQQHKGIDLAVARFSPVSATADGLVTYVGYRSGYGRVIRVEHSGRIETLYGHLQQSKVSVGDRICRGQVIGLAGSSGRSTGPHLHYEIIIDGIQRNPAPFLKLPSYLRKYSQATV